MRTFLSALLVAALASGLAAARPASATPKPRGSDVTTLERHIDGDTFVIRGGEHVRLIGIDTPETHSPAVGVECYGRKASEAMSKLLPVGAQIRLDYDVELRDRYGRLLAYVYRRKDHLFVNAELVRRGFATTLTVPPNVDHVDQFRRLERQARRRDRGLWNVCGGPS